MPQPPVRDQYQQPIRQFEPSTALRVIDTLASRNPNGDFNVDDSKIIIRYAPQYCSEGQSQEDKHDRYVNMTFFILSCISPIIQRMEGSADHHDLDCVSRFKDIKTRLGTCHIVIVTTTRDLAGDGGEITARTKTGRDEQNNTIGQSGLNFIDGSLNAPLEAYADVVKEARENGFRRINCSARMLFFEALELSYLVGYMSPDENIDVKTDAARALDMRSDEAKLRGTR